MQQAQGVQQAREPKLATVVDPTHVEWRVIYGTKPPEVLPRHTLAKPKPPPGPPKQSVIQQEAHLLNLAAEEEKMSRAMERRMKVAERAAKAKVSQYRLAVDLTHVPVLTIKVKNIHLQLHLL
jgi:hypothetical protein